MTHVDVVEEGAYSRVAKRAAVDEFRPERREETLTTAIVAPVTRPGHASAEAVSREQ